MWRLLNRGLFLLILILGISYTVLKFQFFSVVQHDIRGHLSAVRIAMTGQSPYDFLEFFSTNLEATQESVIAIVKDPLWRGPTVITPALITVLLPLAVMPFSMGLLFFKGLTIISWLVLLVVLIRRYTSIQSINFKSPSLLDYGVVVGGVLVLGSAIGFADVLESGQTVGLLTACLYLGLFCVMSPLLKSILFAIAIALKFHCMLVFMPYLLIKKQWKVVGLTSGVFLGLSAFPLFLGIDVIELHRHYVNLMLGFTGGAQSLEASLMRYNILNINYIFRPEWIVLLFRGLLAGGFVLVTWRYRYHSKISMQEVVFLGVITLLPVYHRGYDIVLIAPGLLILFLQCLQQRYWLYSTGLFSFLGIYFVPQTIIYVLAALMYQWPFFQWLLIGAEVDKVLLSPGIYRIFESVFPCLQQAFIALPLYGLVTFILFIVMGGLLLKRDSLNLETPDMK